MNSFRIELLGQLMVVLLAALLVLSAMAKFVRQDATRDTLIALGIGPSTVRIVAPGVSAIEWILGIALLTLSHSEIIRIAALSVFGLFAVAGAYALWSGREIDCECFGSVYSRRLGWRQIALFPAVAAALLVTRPIHWSLEDALLTLVLVHGATALIFVARFVPYWRSVRLQRLSLASAEPPG